MGRLPPWPSGFRLVEGDRAMALLTGCGDVTPSDFKLEARLAASPGAERRVARPPSRRFDPREPGREALEPLGDRTDIAQISRRPGSLVVPLPVFDESQSCWHRLPCDAVCRLRQTGDSLNCRAGLALMREPGESRVPGEPLDAPVGVGNLRARLRRSRRALTRETPRLLKPVAHLTRFPDTDPSPNGGLGLLPRNGSCIATPVTNTVAPRSCGLASSPAC